MLVGNYRINDILKRIDRNKTTILRWEELGLIPKAQRDSRGWRFYSYEEVEYIVSLVKETDYFRNGRNGSNGSLNNNGANSRQNIDNGELDDEWRI